VIGKFRLVVVIEMVIRPLKAGLQMPFLGDLIAVIRLQRPLRVIVVESVEIPGGVIADAVGEAAGNGRSVLVDGAEEIARGVACSKAEGVAGEGPELPQCIQT